MTLGKSSWVPWFRRTRGRAGHRKYSVCTTRCHPCSSHLAFDRHHLLKPGQVITSGASLPTRMNRFASRNVPTAGLVEAWAQSPWSRDDEDFFQAWAQCKGSRTGLNFLTWAGFPCRWAWKPGSQSSALRAQPRVARGSGIPPRLECFWLECFRCQPGLLLSARLRVLGSCQLPSRQHSCIPTVTQLAGED